MKLSSQLKMDVTKVVVITSCYVIINIFLAFHNQGVVMSPLSLGVPETNDFTMYLVISVFMGLIIGLFGGSVMVFVNYKLFQKKSFRFAILTTAISYVILYFFITFLVNFAITWSELGDSASVYNATTISIKNLTAIYALSYFVFWGVITLLTIFFLLVNDKFGPGVLRKFLAGKYFQPRAEKRIFMFLDIKSSTAIAEKIGHKKYFNLLKDFFADITSSITESNGEIYQYVGDEVVVSWSLQNGINNTNCLKCYFDMKKKVDELAPIYKKRYEIVPDFKAALHSGYVTAGEIGSIKRDIIYSGDALNTTARLQSVCKERGKRLIVSAELLSILKDKKIDEKYRIESEGVTKLKGKQHSIGIFSVEENHLKAERAATDR